MEEKGRIDWLLFAIAAGLAMFGTAMVYSASAMIALRESQSQFTYFYKQFAFTAIGLSIMFAVSRIDFRRYRSAWFVYPFLGVTVGLLAVVFMFPEINGASRWIRLGGFSLQPSELAKIALPIFLAYFLTEREATVGDLRSTGTALHRGTCAPWRSHIHRARPRDSDRVVCHLLGGLLCGRSTACAHRFGGCVYVCGRAPPRFYLLRGGSSG